MAEEVGNRTSSLLSSSPIGDKSPNGARKLAVNPKNTGNKLSRTLLGSHPAIFYNIIQSSYYCEATHKNGSAKQNGGETGQSNVVAF